MVTAQLIETARLDLVPLSVSHAEEMAAVLSDPALHTYIGGTPDTPEALRSRYQRMTAGSPDPAVSWLNWVLRPRGSGLVGTVQATVRGSVAEVAWMVGTPWQGRGFATEAAQGLAGWLFQQPIDAIIAHVHPENRASAAVAAAIGLTPTDEQQDGEIRWCRRR
ncbi:GNAT family N-acetyltransferase [Amycolatopsis sp. WGS_07]|uniref:GNAT family N-acetyltransferase n=1 Tax=Amycolatopsis sp. WGS_07 TaxID=3076764 RepID=UPI003873733B